MPMTAACSSQATMSPAATTPSFGKVIATGKCLSVLRKVDGKWRIIRDIWNEDPAKPAAK
jgi:ketosteroid isomerase-like protein